MSFPKELASRPQWVCWHLEPDPKGGKDRKVPYNPITGQRASSTNPTTWVGLETAMEAQRKYHYRGLGFIFTANDGIVGVDIDHCIENGELTPLAKDIVQRYPTYTEISPSGTGLHLFYKGKQPAQGNKNAKSGVEMYDHSRYFTMTGNRLADTPESVADGSKALPWIHETYISRKKPSKKSRKRKSHTSVPLTDEQVLEKARTAKNADDFIMLWNGQWQEVFGSQSEADLALCCALAFWTGKDGVQIDRLFRQSKLFRGKWDTVHHANGTTYGAETIRQAIERTENTYSPEGEPAIFERNGRYYRVKGDAVYPITNFIVQPLEMVETDNEAQMTCILMTQLGETYRLTFMSADFSNVQKFKGVLNKRTIALCYTGGDGDLELFKGYLSELPWVKKTGIGYSGFLQRERQWAFVAGETALDHNGTVILDLVQPEKFVVLETELLDAEPMQASTMQTLGTPILRYNASAKTVAVLAWCAGCFLKEHLRQSHIKYPHLFLIGEAGSGKSNTLERIILPIFARTKVNASTQVTSFTLMKESASSNCIPQALDEFKPSKIDRIRLNALYNHMRDTYDGHAGVRGRADQTQVSYLLLAPLVIAGEQSPDEAAVRERGLELLFSKKDIHATDTREAFLTLTARPENLTSLGRRLLGEALCLSINEAALWHRESLNLFAPSLPSRIRSNLAAVMCGLRLLNRLCSRLDLTWDQVFPISLEECVRFLSFGVQEYLLDGGESNKTIVEQTLEVFDRMKLGAELVHLSEDGSELALYIKDIYDLFTQYVKDHAVDGERLTKQEFIRQLKQAEYYLGSKTVRFSDRVKQAYILNYKALQLRCDVTGFGEMIPFLCKV